MKIAITGHTKGIGKAISDQYSKNGFKVLGFSRSNGYEIPGSINDILGEVISQNISVFINNAFDGPSSDQYMPGIGQEELLWKTYRIWKENADMSIVTIGSMASLYSNVTVNPYFQRKNHIRNLHAAMANNKETKCRMLLVQPGLVHTDRINHYYSDTQTGIDPDPVGKTVYELERNRDLLVTEVSIRTDLDGYPKDYSKETSN